MMRLGFLMLTGGLGLIVLAFLLSIYFKDRLRRRAIAIITAVLAFTFLQGISYFILVQSGYAGLSPVDFIDDRRVLAILSVVLWILLIPYLFIVFYELTRIHIQRDLIGPYSSWMAWAIVFFCAVTAVNYQEYAITCIYLILPALLFTALVWLFRPVWFGRFFITWVIFQIPCLLVLNVLFGSYSEQGLIWFNQAEILGFYIGSVPFEVLFHNMFTLLCVVIIMEVL